MKQTKESTNFLSWHEMEEWYFSNIKQISFRTILGHKFDLNEIQLKRMWNKKINIKGEKFSLKLNFPLASLFSFHFFPFVHFDSFCYKL